MDLPFRSNPYLKEGRTENREDRASGLERLKGNPSRSGMVEGNLRCRCSTARPEVGLEIDVAGTSE